MHAPKPAQGSPTPSHVADLVADALNRLLDSPTPWKPDDNRARQGDGRLVAGLLLGLERAGLAQVTSTGYLGTAKLHAACAMTERPAAIEARATLARLETPGGALPRQVLRHLTGGSEDLASKLGLPAHLIEDTLDWCKSRGLVNEDGLTQAGWFAHEYATWLHLQAALGKDAGVSA